MDIKIINRSGHPLPAYSTKLAAGMDIRAYLPQGAVQIESLERKLIPTGLFLELPAGFEGQVRPRSGLALHSGITILNSPGTVDADYRGELRVLVINLSAEMASLEHGDRIAQLVVARHETVTWVDCGELSETERGEGGYGHTGTH